MDEYAGQRREMQAMVSRCLEAERAGYFVAAHRRLADMAEMAPGPTLLSALLAVRDLPMDTTASLLLYRLWAKQRAFEDAQSMIVTIELLDGPGELPGITDSQRRMVAAQEIADVTHVSYGSAAHTVDLTRRVAAVCDVGWEALHRGDWTLAHLQALASATDHCPELLASAVDAVIVPLALVRGWTPATVRAQAARVIIELDPDGAAERAAEKKRQADVTFYPHPDEAGTLIADGDVITARQIYDTLNARAAQLKSEGDNRATGARRFAALAEFVLGHDTTIEAPAEAGPTEPVSGEDVDDSAGQERHDEPKGDSTTDEATESDSAALARSQDLARRRGEALVRVDLTTALGDNDNPGELDGYGPISAATARRFAATAMWRRMVTDPITGDLHHLATDRYTPTAEIRRWVITRDRRCQFTGCNRPARRCQIDHRVPHGDQPGQGGPTCICNLQPLCLMHHQFKTNKWFSCAIDEYGNTHWINPAGLTTTNRRNEIYPVVRLPAHDPPEDWAEPDPSPSTRANLLVSPYPDELDRTYGPEPPLDTYEHNVVNAAVTPSWVDEYNQRVYGVLASAGLLSSESPDLESPDLRTENRPSDKRAAQEALRY